MQNLGGKQSVSWGFENSQLANVVLPGGRVYANSSATPELFAHTCIPIQTYKLLNMEDFTGNTSRFKDWLICQGQEKLEYTV